MFIATFLRSSAVSRRQPMTCEGAPYLTWPLPAVKSIRRGGTPADGCPAAREFMASVPAVEVLIKVYKGSGAVCIHKVKRIVVSNALKGGAHEAADAFLFELYNWKQGDYLGREQERVKIGEITPK